MPHVSITGPCSVAAYWEHFEPAIDRQGDRIVRAITVYLARRENRALIECTVVEGYLRQIFLVEMIQREDGALVRLFHGSSPEKTEGVRYCLAWIAKALLAQDPACAWKTQNLGIPLPPTFPRSVE
jgi:hypothetical protein